MAIAFSLERKSHSLRELKYEATLTFSGNYVSGGEVSGFIRKMPTTKAPLDVRLENTGGYRLEYDYTNDKILVFEQGAAASPAPQIPVAAYPAALLASVTKLHAIFPKFG